MTDIQEEQIKNQAQIIKEEIEGLLDTSNTIEEAVIETSNQSQSWGKTLEEWYKVLTVPLDPSADPSRVKMYCSQLSQSLDIAYRFLNKTKVLAFNYGLSYNKAFNEKIAAQALNRARKVAPAMDTMTRVAENQMPERVLTQKRLEMMVEFWESMVWKIKDQIHIVNIMSMSNGTLYKVGEIHA
jgi:hypothetical protein